MSDRSAHHANSSLFFPTWPFSPWCLCALVVRHPSSPPERGIMSPKMRIMTKRRATEYPREASCSHERLEQHEQLTRHACNGLTRPQRSRGIARSPALPAPPSWPVRTRTLNDRVRICSVTNYTTGQYVAFTRGVTQRARRRAASEKGSSERSVRTAWRGASNGRPLRPNRQGRRRDVTRWPTPSTDVEGRELTLPARRP
jgi:hypothetical protein